MCINNCYATSFFLCQKSKFFLLEFLILKIRIWYANGETNFVVNYLILSFY